MINVFRYPTMADAHQGMCERLFLGDTPGRDYDWSHGAGVGLHDVVIEADSFEYNMDLKRLWIPPSRWTMMVRQYIHPDALDHCLGMVEQFMTGKHGGNQAKGIAILRTRPVQGRGTGKNVRRRWGSCMLNLAYRALPTPTVTLNSRTTYFGYLAAVDVAVAHAFARRVSAITGTPVGAMRFVWRLDRAEFHSFRSLAWVLGDPELKAMVDEDVYDRRSLSARPGKGVQVGYRKALDGYSRLVTSDDRGTMYEDEKFSSFLRIRKRFHTEVMGPDHYQRFTSDNTSKGKAFPPLPPLWSGDLGFENLKSIDPDEPEDDDGDE